MIAAFDLLFKMYCIFNLCYPRSLQNFHSFIEHYVYKFNNNVLAVVRSLPVNLCNIEPKDNSESEDDVIDDAMYHVTKKS